MHSLNLSLSLLLVLLHRDSSTLHFALNTCALDCKRQVQKSASALPAIITNNRVHNKNAVAEKKNIYNAHSHTSRIVYQLEFFNFICATTRIWTSQKLLVESRAHHLLHHTHTDKQCDVCTRGAIWAHSYTYYYYYTRTVLYPLHNCWLLVHSITLHPVAPVCRVFACARVANAKARIHNSTSQIA